MTQALTRPAEFFDDKYGMDATSLQRVLGKTLGKQIDYADLYFQYEVSDAVALEEGLVKQASKHVNQGVGVRAVAGEKTGYAFSDEITVSTLEIAAHTARQIASSGAETASVAIRGAQTPVANLYPVQTPGPDIPIARKLDLCRKSTPSAAPMTGALPRCRPRSAVSTSWCSWPPRKGWWSAMCNP